MGFWKSVWCFKQNTELVMNKIKLITVFLAANLFFVFSTTNAETGKGSSYLDAGVYYSDIELPLRFENEQIKALESGIVFNLELRFQIVDVRIKRADLPPANSEAIYKRMQTEREREAKEFRAQGAEIAQKIRSTADKDVTVILAEANKKSEIMKGEGDGERNKIFANAFGRDPQFFAFYRAMQAYEKALIGGETSLVLSPDSDFFKFFGKSIKPNIKR